jgi:hypothetical protein
MIMINVPLTPVIAMKDVNMKMLIVTLETNVYHGLVMLKKVANMRTSILVIMMLALMITVFLKPEFTMTILSVMINLNVLTIAAITLLAVFSLQ